MCASYIQSTPVHSILFSPLWSYWAHLLHIGPIQSTLVLFGLHWSYLVHSIYFGPIQSTLILFSPIWSYSVHYVHFAPNLSMCSYLVLFSRHWSNLSNSVHFVPFGRFVSTLVHSDYFDPFWFTSVHFCALTYREKKHVWVESTYSISKFIF